MSIQPDEIEAFCVSLQAHLQQLANARKAADKPIIEAETGPRYVRLVLSIPGTRSAYGFIDKTNGDLLKASGWKSPAKHARGNIRDKEPLKYCGPYGMAYLR